MSIEKLLSDLIVAINENTAALRSAPVTGNAAPAPIVQPVQAYVAPAPVVPITPVAPVVQQLPVSAPTFQQAVTTPTGNKAPFQTLPDMMAYVMAAYQAMGAEKGSRIQGILTQLGTDNINNVRPDQFDALFLAVEQLKVS